MVNITLDRVVRRHQQGQQGFLKDFKPEGKGSGSKRDLLAQVPDVRRALGKSPDATTSFPRDRRLGTRWRERWRDKLETSET